ncbi:MAG TPA: PIN domain-containing protein [Methanoregulaceae archaeon]|nr:PIN domain-containing protein [Methanoregulaceae archaeon]
MTAAPPLVDTNILVYLFDRDEPDKRTIARGIVEGCFSGHDQLAVSIQNLAEFAVVMTEKVEHPMPREMVSRFIRDIASFSQWWVLGYDAACIEDAVAIGGERRIHFWDALLVATMKRHGITTLYSEDEHFIKVPDIRVVNPFIR